MEYLDKNAHECWACIHSINGICDTYCDHGESFIQRKDVKIAVPSLIQESAHWYYDPNANDWGLGGWCCSSCHYKNDSLGMSEHLRFPIDMIAGTKYCANCGRKMNEVTDDDN